jgi:hypothetical protein
VIPLTLWDAGIGFVYPRSKLTERRLQANNVKLDDAKSWPELRDNLANLQLLQEGPNKRLERLGEARRSVFCRASGQRLCRKRFEL